MVPRTLVSAPEYKIVLDPAARAMQRRILSSIPHTDLGSFTVSTQGLAGNRFETAEEPADDAWYPFLVKGQARRYFLDIGQTAYADMSDKPSLVQYYGAQPKLLIRRVISRQDRLLVATTSQAMVFKKDINPFLITDTRWDLHYVLGILNSRLVSYLYVNTSAIAAKDDFRQTTLAELRRLPIAEPDDSGVLSAKIGVAALAMTRLFMELENGRTGYARTALERQIAATDRQIDQLVYELYGLTDDEIRIVEEATQ